MELFLATAPLDNAMETVVCSVKSLFHKQHGDIYSVYIIYKGVRHSFAKIS
jgi:hypothetical protein